MKISAIILTKNEEKNIERAIKSIQFCDDIIIVDDYSEDKTLDKIRNFKSEIRNKFKIQIFKRKLNDNFAEQRNFAMERAKGEWILFVDADEVVTPELRKEITSFFRRDVINHVSTMIKEHSTFYLKRRDFWWGRELKYGETRKVRQTGLIRLMRQRSGKWEGKVHEEYIVRSEKLEVRRLKSYLNHYPHQTLKEFLWEINFYSTLRARELFEKDKKINIFEIISYPLGKFLLTYFIKLGFLDGPAGFAYAFLMSFHSFLVRAKLYQYKKIDKFDRYSGEQ